MSILLAIYILLRDNIREHRGNWFYEWQIGPLVLQWRHFGKHTPWHRGIHIGRFYAWRDPTWRLPLRIRRLIHH